jgi:hypothetical protein
MLMRSGHWLAALTICSLHHLQPFIDALGGYSATVHMEISVAKMKVMIMVVSNPCVSSPAPVAAVVTCNGHSAH